MASGKITITGAQLSAYAEQLKRQQALNAELAAVKEEISQFEALVHAQMDAAGKTTARRLGWSFVLTTGNATVAWKKEFIRVAGGDAATQLALDAKGNGKTTLAITPPLQVAAAATAADPE